MVSGAVEGCSCMIAGHGLGVNLTFSNFASDGTGEYSCLATSTPFDVCNFDVIITGKDYC